MSFAHLLLICLIPITTSNDLYRANNVFANELYQQLAKPRSNLVFSPLGVYSMLALTYLGSTGQTERMLRIAVDFRDKAELAKQYKDLITFLIRERANVNLRMVSKIYIEGSFKLVEKFRRVATEYFDTDISTIRFSDAQQVNKDVNVWFNEETNGHVSDFDELGDISRLTTVMMLNALYFKSTWNVPFTVIEDTFQPFYISSASTVPTQFMNNSGEYGYYESDVLDAKCLRIDFKNLRFSATFILPNSRDGIGDLEENLRFVNITSINNLMEEKEVEVAIPSFEIQDGYDLEEALRAIGLDDLFDTDGITELSDGNLRMGKVMQKALISADALGVSATAGVANDQISNMPMFTFIANHPFIYTINVNMDDENGDEDDGEAKYVVLFMGKVYNPN